MAQAPTQIPQTSQTTATTTATTTTQASSQENKEYEQLLKTIKTKMQEFENLSIQMAELESELRDLVSRLEEKHSKDVSQLKGELTTWRAKSADTSTDGEKSLSVKRHPSQAAPATTPSSSASPGSPRVGSPRQMVFIPPPPPPEHGTSTANNTNSNSTNNNKNVFTFNVPSSNKGTGNTNNVNNSENSGDKKNLDTLKTVEEPKHGRTRSGGREIDFSAAMAQAQLNRPLASTEDTRPTSKSHGMDIARAQTDRGPATGKAMLEGTAARSSKENLLAGISPLQSGTQPANDPNNAGAVKKTEKEIILPACELTERDFFKKYWIEAGKIGEGAFSRIRKISRKADKKVFALKMIKKKGKSKSDIRALQKEIYVLQRCDHPNIVQLLDWCDTKTRIYMVVEFCDGGDVFERVVNLKKFSEADAAHVVRQVASGLQHLHKQGFVHRDLKPDNVMYLTKAQDSAIKIIDFGLAGDCNDGPCTTPCGTAHYAAPEVLGNQPYGVEADIWSLGVIVYTLLCGFPPFFDPNNNMKNLYHLIKKAKYAFPSPFWDAISEDAKDLVTKCLVKEPKERLTAEQILSHPWVAGKVETKGDFSEKYLEQLREWQNKRHQTELNISEKPKTVDDLEDDDLPTQ